MLWNSIHAQRDFFHYHVPMARAIGIQDAIFTTFVIWKQYTQEDQIELMVEDIISGTALTYEQQRGVRKRLKALGILEERTLRLQHRTFYRINPEQLESVVNKALPAPEMVKPQIGAVYKSSSPILGNNSTKNKETGPCGPDAQPITKATAPEHTAIVRQWHEGFMEFFGMGYVMHGGADGKAAKQLLTATKLTADQIINVARAAWGKQGKKFWACENKSRTIREFAANWNKIVSELGGISGALRQVLKEPPPGLKPASNRPPPGFDDDMNPIPHEDWDQRFPLSDYYDETTNEQLS